ncbi:MAG: glycosyltransferase [Goleter apudmare HA4340-LM2]|jgi:GT2 family glycosyltransferase|nr:glycosyltransferase [Goleter apudmare HA4340-LM2]
MQEAKVTLIVVPRERYSYTQKSLENIYKNTDIPFELIYVDVNSPSSIKHYLEAQSQEKKFHLIRVNHFLNPNHSRNLALDFVKTEYVVFIDNDVLVKPGWLDALIKCADETGAWIVGPLCLEGDDFAKVHIAGGSYEFKQRGNERWMIIRRPCFRTPLSKVRIEFKRQPTQAIEFHCVLVRMDVFKELGLLDEQVMGIGQEDDLCLTVLQSGKPIYFEPASVMTYVPPQTLAWSDMPFFYLRWSQAWCEVSINRLRAKWNLAEDAPVVKSYKTFIHVQTLLPEPRVQKGYSYINWIVKFKIKLLGRKIIMRLLRKLINLQARLNLIKSINF